MKFLATKIMQKIQRKPSMFGEKICIKCKCAKSVEFFHAHKQMADGRLNKCSDCVVKYVAEWRGKNPSARKIEHRRLAEKNGIQTRDEWKKKVSLMAAGRKSVALKYSHKRRVQELGRPVFDSEFDDLAFIEAKQLSEMRSNATGFLWVIDHIVPLNHRLASGLHNGFNLNVVPSDWNVRKSNRNMDRYFGSASA